MKIAIVSSGNSIHVKKIANALAEKGFDITLYTIRNHDRLLSDFNKKIKVVKLPFSGAKGYILNAPILRYFLTKNKCDLINSHYASGYGTLVRLANVHPLALAVFGSDVFEYPFLSKKNMQRICKNFDNADIITSTSEVMKQKLLSFYKTEKEVYVTPFGVNLDIFHKIDVKKHDGFKFGIIKKIEPLYGHDILIKAFKIFSDKYPEANASLEIYGRGTGVDSLKQLTKELEIEDKVHFRGFVKNELVPEVYSGLDVACFSSKADESFGVSAIEAMACGVPVIATNAKGFTEVIEEGVTGIIVSKDSVSDFAEAMITMYNLDSEERRNIGENGIRRVKKFYNNEENIQTYIEAIMHYKEL